ncbi:MAG: reverse gyrase [Fervidicoccaceae archaeon]
MVKAVYANSCPNCGGPISSVRLAMGLPCSSCLPSIGEEEAKHISFLTPGERFKLISKKISSTAEGSYSMLAELHEELDRFERFFKRCVGKEFWSLQRTWAYRILSGDSFAITAPTGVGKTTLLLVYSLYEASEGTRVLILVPTESLLRQSLERLHTFSRTLGAELRILGYLSKASKREKEENIRKIESGDFDILITTTSFLSRKFNILKNKLFGLIVVDDADSLLKDSLNVNRVLELSGFKSEEIEAAMRAIKLRNELYFLKAAGRGGEKIEQMERELEELEILIARVKGERARGQLLISSATGRQSGIRPKLFKELLGFEIGGIHAYMRNVIDSYEIQASKESIKKRILDLVRALGSGGLIFISKDAGTSEAKELANYLLSNGIKADLAIAGKSSIEKLRKGDVDILIGISSYYGVAVRGVDIPDKIKYAIFVGVPKNRVPLRSSLISPRRLLQVIAYLSDIDSSIKESYISLAQRLAKLTPSEINVLRISLMNGSIDALGGWLKEIAEEIMKGIESVEKVLKNVMKVGDYLSVGTAIIFRESSDDFYMINPDPLTYIQASGRTSRFLDEKMTLGLSIILESDIRVLEAFQRKMSIFSRSFVLSPLSKLDLEKIKELLEESRKGGKGIKSFRPAKSLLMIVESPNKARTIAWYFGRPSRRKFGRITAYEVPIIDEETLDTYLVTIVATKGHVFDLPVNDGIGAYGVIVKDADFVPVYAPITFCLSCKKSFSSIELSCPYCGEKNKLVRSTEIIQVLRKLSLEAEEVVIATDPDVEGEKIAWDVYLMLKPFSKKISRAEFHEITPDAILRSLRNLREVNISRVSAQIMRRITDRWIGFPLSSILKEKYGKPWLGAGRVQTPVLGWTISRYAEWKRDRGFFIRAKGEAGIEVSFFRKNKEEAENLAALIERNGYLEIISCDKKTEQINPLPPYTTDSLLFDASRSLGLSSTTAMKILQDLFEAGLITYHRTDSTHISNKGISVAKEYFEKVLKKPELFYPRTWGEEGAHEAIRPTRPLGIDDLRKGILDGTLKIPINLTKAHLELYDLIFKRFIASQARASIVEKIIMKIASPNGDYDEKEILLREISEGFASIIALPFSPEAIKISSLGRLKIFEKGVSIYKSSLTPLHSEGTLVKMMKERRLGRPSTYAKIIDSLRRHGYIVISKKRSFVIPTSIGIEVHTFLTESFPDLIMEEATKKLEERMDSIESGQSTYEDVLKELYNKLNSIGVLDRKSISTSLSRGFVEEALA